MVKKKLAKNETNNDTKHPAIKFAAKAPQQDQPAKTGILQDARFQHLVSDPRFKQLPQTQRKVKIDKRFQSMFTDDKFNIKYQVDKYGRRINKSNAEDLRKYYEMNSDDSIDEDDEAAIEEAEQRKEERAITRDTDDTDNEIAANDKTENDDLVSDGEDVPKSLKERLLDPNIDYARGEGRLITDSSSDDESSDDEDDPEMYIDHVWGELDNDAETTDESTNRLAVCHMDWDRIRAQDLMVLFSSFLPPGGSILSVTIYPSQYGKERMAEEDKNGPIELQGLGKMDKQVHHSDDYSSATDDDDDLVKEQDSDAEEGDDYHMEKLRQYQLNRLRYYYAVVVCDSVATADKIYKECDGIEYESSATRVDLRFVPDETSFDEDEPTDTCTELPDTNNYQPRQFTTTALQQAKVDLTWDETAVERRELGDKLASGRLDAIDDKELRKIVAYSSEDDEDDENQDADNATKELERENSIKEITEEQTAKQKSSSKNKKENAISKYKALLAEINEKEEREKRQKYEMEFTWNIEETKETNDEKDQDNPVANKSLLTPIERVLQKKSEKNKKRKEERKKKKLQAMGIDPDTYNSDDDNDSIPDGVDMNDPYFAEEFQNGNFVKPSASTKTKKQKKNKKEKSEDDEEAEQQAKELALLVDDDDEDEGKQHFSLDKIQKAEQETKSKKKRRKQLKKSKTTIADERKEIEDNFQINLNDERFQAIYKSPHFNIDPTDSHYKKTKAMEQIIHEKLKRRHGEENQTHVNSTAPKILNEEEPTTKRPKKQVENTLLIKSLKRKIQMKQQTK